MKNAYKLFCTVLLLFSGEAAMAQVAAYGFNQYQGTYSAITGGTVFGTGTSDDDYFCNPNNPTLSQNTGPGIPIGFTFTFNSIPFDVFGINNNGWIAFGQSTLTPNPVNLNSSSGYTGLSATSTAPGPLQHRVVALGRDIQGNGGSLRVQTIGSAPNRTCVIQWSNYRVFAGSDNFSFQIRLMETTNLVQIVQGAWVTVTSTSAAEVGLRGATNADYNNRSVVSPNSWSTSIAGTANNVTVGWNTTTLVPINGQVYEWIPNIPCGTVPNSNAVTTITNVCPGATLNIGLSLTYTNTGYQYQWQASTSGTNGVFSNITGTNPTVPTGTLGTTIAYRAVITCTNGPTSINTTPILINVGAPAVSNAVATPTLICPGENGVLSLSTNYAGLGVGYQWQSSTQSGLGPFTNVTGTTPATSGTLATLTSSNVTVNTYYQAILSCTANASFSVATPAATVNVQGLTTSVVPYLETFEGITVNNRLPNCSWAASNRPTINQTYTTANTFNRIPNNGQKFASFRSGTNANGDYFYTNGIQLYAGITYSASVAYITDGLLGWSEFSLLYGQSQSSVGLTSIASVTGAVTGTSYKYLSNTFTVATSGMYYIAVKAIGNSTPQYLSFDDLSVTIPCSENEPPLTVTPSNTVFCEGDEITLTANGADSYLWNNGATTSSIVVTAAGMNVFNVTGSSTLTGCSVTESVSVQILLSPIVSVFANNPVSCAGQPVNISAFGAVNYNWGGGGAQGNNNFITVNPTSNTTYSVTGTHANGCSRTATIAIAVNPLPTVGITTDVNPEICAGESMGLFANGASNYQWLWNTNVSTSPTLQLNPVSTTAFTLTGTDAKGCQNTAQFVQNVSPCAGIGTHLQSGNQLGLYPNPAIDKVILVSTFKGRIEVAISDMAGRRIFENSNLYPGAEVSLIDLPAGVYYVQMKSEGVINTLKLVKH